MSNEAVRHLARCAVSLVNRASYMDEGIYLVEREQMHALAAAAVAALEAVRDSEPVGSAARAVEDGVATPTVSDARDECA